MYYFCKLINKIDGVLCKSKSIDGKLQRGKLIQKNAVVEFLVENNLVLPTEHDVLDPSIEVYNPMDEYAL